MQINPTAWCTAVLTLIAVTACGPEGGQPPEATPADPPESAAPTAAGSQAGTGTAAANLPRLSSPEGARVFFESPQDGDVVTSPVKVEFAVDGMQVVPAGQAAPDSGHHHVLIDTGLPPLGQPIPADARHVHFGDGSSSTELDLEPGRHTLQLLFADHLHVPHDPPVYSEPITITVE